MTEEEAKTKMCFRAATFAGSQQIADGPGPCCIGSQCMAWRWIGRDDGDVIATNDGHIPKSQAHGYCGLAGKP